MDDVATQDGTTVFELPQGEENKILLRINSKRTELDPLYRKMDRHTDIYNLEPFQLMDYNGKTALKRVDNVTLNDPFTYAKRLMQKINKAILNITLDDKTVKDYPRDKIINFANAGLLRADKFLKNKRMGKIRNSLVKIAALRGVLGVRVLLWEDNGKKYWDVLPVDTLFSQWEYGLDGLIWGNIETERSGASIKDEYPNSTTNVLKNKVWEYYDRDYHIIFVNSKVVKAEKNALGYVPIFIAPVGQAMTLRKRNEKDSVKRDGNTIYDGSEDTFYNDNKLASIWMTTAAYGFRPPMQRTTPPNAPDMDEIPPEAQQAYTGGQKVVDMGYSRLEPMPLKDVAQSLPSIFGVLGANRQRNTFPDIEWGEVRYPLSAVAITKLTDGNNEQLADIVDVLCDCYKFILDEFRKQAIANSWDETDYPLDTLKNPAEYQVELFLTSPEEDIALLSIAAAARGIYDDNTIREQICHQRDEGRIAKALDEQKVNEMFPELLAYRTAMQYEKDRPIEAQIILTKLAQEGLTNLVPGTQPAPPTPPAQGTPAMPPMPPLGIGTGGQGAPPPGGQP